MLPHRSDLLSGDAEAERWEQRETHEHQEREEMELSFDGTKVGCVLGS